MIGCEHEQYSVSDRFDRRDILKMGLGAFLGASVPLFPAGSAHAARRSSAHIAFRNVHTGESFSGVYRVGEKYLPDAFERINHVLRDFRTGEVFPMDPRVLDLIKIIHERTGSKRSFEVLSGYRSPKTNSMLRQVSTGVAKNSLHMYGQAIDLRLPGYGTRKLRDVARKIRAGGVGYYPKSDFVHVDTGKVRYW